MADENAPNGEVPETEEQPTEQPAEEPQAPAPEAVQDPATPPAPAPTPEAPKKSGIKGFLKSLSGLHYALAAAVVVILVLAGLLVAGSGSSSDTTQTADTADTRAIDAEDEDKLLSDDEIHSEAGNDNVVEVEDGEPLVEGDVTWETNIVYVDDLPLFDAADIETYYDEKEASFGYEIRGEQTEEAIRSRRLGVAGGKTIYLQTVLVAQGLGEVNASFFVIEENGAFTVTQWNAKNMIDELSGDFDLPTFVDDVTVSTNGTIPELSYPESISYNDVTAERTSTWYIPSGGTNEGEAMPRLVAGDQIFEGTKVGKSTLYEVVRDIESADGVKTVELILELPNGFRVQYRYITSLMSDDNSIPITWTNDNSTTMDVYRWDLVWAGCGAVNQPLVLDKQYHKDLQVVGTSNGQDVFWLNDANHPTVEALFTSSSASLGDNAITQQEFYDDRPAIVVRNELGYYLILNNEKYQRAAECAKPVIYLYPETPTFVEVQVGADVTISDPLYGDGWSATAMPDGTLITDSGLYTYLFWDGYGHGPYPEITKGNFVKRANVEARMIADMQYMGLNEQEIADFIEYWMPLMPDTEYVRLTWFNTQEMDTLAPLTLNFTPDSSIRVFLDYEGVDAPYDLPQQVLPQYERTGFTLVEWGGLRVGR